METLLRGVSGLRLDDSISSVSDLLDTEPGRQQLSQLIDTAQGLACGPSHNGLGVERGLQLLSAGRPLEALHHLAESHSTTLRQYMIMKSSCRLAQLQVKSGSRVEGWPAGTQEALLDTRRRLLQYRPDPERREEVLQLISQVPPEWTVIQLTAVPRARSRLTRHDTPELVVARFEGGDADSLLLTRVPAPPADHCCTFLSEFEAMLADNGSIQRSLSNDRQKYWAERGLLDDRMKSIVRSMEVAWLGRHAYLLSGRLLRPQHRQAVSQAVGALPPPLSAEQRARLRLLAARLPETAAGLTAGVSAALGPAASADQRGAVTEALAGRRDQLEEAAAGARRGQVILVLDREVQRYPWETVAGLALGPVCRLPSLALLELCLTNRRETASPSPAAGGATYILNPAGDLANTEQRMAPFLEQRGWSGIVGRPPTLREFSAALTDGQIMAYCGHGSGSQYLPAEKLRALHCNAVALLFGCSSGQLVQPGPTADPHGAVLAYLMANCPAILGNLWSVTDNTLDTYSKAVIEDWADGPGGRSLPEAVSAARAAVASTFMAAAPVVYGLPVTAEGVQLDRSRRGGPGTADSSTAERTDFRARLDAVADRSHTADRSRLEPTLDRSRLAAPALDRTGLGTADVRSLKTEGPADRSRLDRTAADRSRLQAALADRTNMNGTLDVSLTRDSDGEHKAAGDRAGMDATQNTVRSGRTPQIGETDHRSREHTTENGRAEDASRRHTRIPTKVGSERAVQGAPGSEQPQGGARAGRQTAAGEVPGRPTATRPAGRPQRASRRI